MFSTDNTQGYTDAQIDTLNRACSAIRCFEPRMDDWTREQAQKTVEERVLAQYDNDASQSPEEIAYAVAGALGWR